ncbi:hypothetical protein N0V95_002512 [Ascochyta clinopodiicola]|nr:hypothetical protein N0V95_002512 [Ascochyta clinopodiicola]
MAPTPVDSALSANTTSTAKPDENYWKPANIAFTAVVSALALGVIIATIAFFIYRHRQHKELVVQSTPAKEGLLNGDERKSIMFSRERASSVTVYVDHADTDTAYKRINCKRRQQHQRHEQEQQQYARYDDVEPDLRKLKTNGQATKYQHIERALLRCDAYGYNNTGTEDHSNDI